MTFQSVSFPSVAAQRVAVNGPVISRKEILGQACNSAILARIGFVEAQEG
jgi:hypothetical protein